MRASLFPAGAHQAGGGRRTSSSRPGFPFCSLHPIWPLAAALVLSACAPRLVAPPPGTATGRGTASWYGDEFHGRPTSSGVRYNMYGMTAASKTLPLGCRIRVTRLDTGKNVIVTVNDRGPFVGDRILDLSYEAARRLDMLETGLATVRIDILGVPPGTAVATAPEAPPAPAPQPAAVRPAATPAAAPPVPQAYWISVGTFAIQGNAVWLQSKLAREVPSIGIRLLTRGTATLYQVRVGPYRTAEETEKGRAMLAKLGFKSSLVQEQ